MSTASATSPTGSTSTTAPAPEPSAIIAQIQRLAWQLAAIGKPTAAPGLQLSPIDCTRLEATTGLGTTRSGEELVRAVERLASMRIGDIRLPFTPGQLAELQHRASKRGRTLEAEMQAVVDRIQDELFYKGG